MLTKCSFLLTVAKKRLEQGERDALNCFSEFFFPAGFSSLMPSIITVEMIIFLALPPNSQRSSAFPILARKMTWRGTVSVAFPFCLRQPLIHPALTFPTSRGTRGQCRGMKMFFPTSILEVKTSDPEGLWQHGKSWTHLKLSLPGPKRDAQIRKAVL